MKLKSGFAPEIRNAAWIRPSMAPITNADEADGICLLFLILAIPILPSSELDLHIASPGADRI
uniref:Uncharacterized protein n=1 Tax=Rhizophora mucronata TaxID=61149 RepID=A0A2P2IWR1_RHIMU